MGDSEANRDKNRYPYILPCKCRLIITAHHTRSCLIQLFSGSRRPLPGEAVGSELPPTLRLHQRKLCAGRSWIGVSHVPCTSAKAVTLVFRAVDRRETSSAPRGLCRTPWSTSGGWCGSKTSGWSSWWRLWGTKTRWGRWSRSVSMLTTDTKTHSDLKQNKMAVYRNLMNGWSNICMFVCRCCVKNTGPRKEAQFIMDWSKSPRWPVNKVLIVLSPASTSDRWDDGGSVPLNSCRLPRLFRWGMLQPSPRLLDSSQVLCPTRLKSSKWASRWRPCLPVG